MPGVHAYGWYRVDARQHVVGCLCGKSFKRRTRSLAMRALAGHVQKWQRTKENQGGN